MTVRLVSVLALAILTTVLAPPAVPAPDIDRAAMTYQLPADIKWRDSPTNPGVKQALLHGDPGQPGLYIVLVKWLPGHMSRPHFHPNDRFIVVLSGTWWAGTGPRFDPDNTVPLPAGSFVTHVGGKVHYDGAKDEETVLRITGMGPATSTRVTEDHPPH